VQKGLSAFTHHALHIHARNAAQIVYSVRTSKGFFITLQVGKDVRPPTLRPARPPRVMIAGVQFAPPLADVL
jgi:hypothetical protein